MFDVSQLADTGGDWLAKGNALLNQGVQAYQTVTNATKQPQTAAEVAAGAPAKPARNWTPIIIVASVLGLLGLGWLFTRKP